MSRNELIDAYRSGRISRRAFVRGMVGAGLSVSAAVALADNVRATPASKPSTVSADDAYEDTYNLPSTGSGPTGTGDSWAKPLAILGAGAALVAGGLRRLKGTSPTAE